jgi:hypothetical protein
VSSGREAKHVAVAEALVIGMSELAEIGARERSRKPVGRAGAVVDQEHRRAAGRHVECTPTAAVTFDLLGLDLIGGDDEPGRRDVATKPVTDQLGG